MGAQKPYLATQCLWRWAHVIRFAEKETEMTAPETQTIDFELDADWATLWLNRPDARNARRTKWGRKTARTLHLHERPP